MTAMGDFFVLAGETFSAMFRRPLAWRELIDQIWFVARVSIVPTLMLSIPYTVLIVFTLNIVLLEVDHFAVFGGLGILSREPMFGKTVVNNDDLGLAELLSKRLDESMAGPRPMDGFDAKSNVLNGYRCFHVSPRGKEFASKFDGMAIVFETLRAAFDMQDRAQWSDVPVKGDQRIVKGLLKVVCGTAHDFSHHI